jgi:hypothetical protein
MFLWFLSHVLLEHRWAGSCSAVIPSSLPQGTINLKGMINLAQIAVAISPLVVFGNQHSHLQQHIRKDKLLDVSQSNSILELSPTHCQLSRSLGSKPPELIKIEKLLWKAITEVMHGKAAEAALGVFFSSLPFDISTEDPAVAQWFQGPFTFISRSTLLMLANSRRRITSCRCHQQRLR